MAAETQKETEEKLNGASDVKEVGYKAFLKVRRTRTVRSSWRWRRRSLRKRPKSLKKAKKRPPKSLSIAMRRLVSTTVKLSTSCRT